MPIKTPPSQHTTTAEKPLLPRQTADLPALLVSVRDALEAQIALEAGIQLIDVKDPSAGPLGAAGPEVLHEVAEIVASSSNIHFSAALGELQTLSERKPPFLLCPALNFVKIGLSGCRPLPDWKERFRQAQERLKPLDGMPGTIAWVAVVYADHSECDAPLPEDVLNFAIQAGCVGLLIDTFTKTGKSTFEFMTVVELFPLRRLCREKGLFFALAGSIKTEHLALARELEPDVIAVRGAVCAGTDRTAEIDSRAIQNFQAAIRRAWKKPSPL